MLVQRCTQGVSVNHGVTPEADEVGLDGRGGRETTESACGLTPGQR